MPKRAPGQQRLELVDRPAGRDRRAQLRARALELENARLSRELAASEARLKEALEQQAATTEVLRIISRSPTDLPRVLEAIAASAARLCRAPAALIQRVVDGQIQYEAGHVDADVPEAAPYRQLQIGHRVAPITARTVSGRALRERRTLHIPDMAAAAETSYPDSRPNLLVGGGTSLSVPLLRGGEGLGIIALFRLRVMPFTDREIALAERFADQAVIAIENARLFRELAAKSAQLEEASRHKSEFLANMSHELRTPLNAIIGFSEVLLERYFGEVNAKQEEYLRDVLSSGQHLLSLINDILDLSKIEAGRVELEPTTFALGPVLESGLVMVKERAGRHGIQLGLEVDPELGRISADERKVKQVVFNLLSNAVKFTPDGGRVDVRAWRADGQVHVAVRDTGVGIAAEDQARIFEEFQQARGPAAGKVEGTGLGLALARRFVELHGGRIRVDSALGEGSTFTFALPVEAPWPAS